jgi:hypothetical protein
MGPGAARTRTEADAGHHAGHDESLPVEVLAEGDVGEGLRETFG